MSKKRFFKIFIYLFRAKEVINCIMTTPQWLTLIMGYLNLKPLDYPFEFSTRKGQKIVLNNFYDLVTVWVIFFRKEYAIPQSCRVMIDAGANIGTFSIYSSTFNVEKIYAIEPFPMTFDQFKKNIDLNSLNPKIKSFQLALSGSDGTRTMDLSPGPSQSRGLLADTNEKGLTVPAMSLKSFLSQIGEKKIDLLKIDIEGGEYDVFEHCDQETFNKINEIVMEYHPTGDKKNLFRQLTHHGYLLKKEIKFSPKSGLAHFVKDASL